MAVQGFRLLDHELGLSARSGAPFQIEEVRFGFEPARRLQITLGDREGLDHIVVDDPTSHRVQDERDMLDYWSARSGEGVGNGCVYQIAQSPYLSELSQGVSSFERALVHYLILGEDICVEVIAYERPRLIEMSRG